MPIQTAKQAQNVFGAPVKDPTPAVGSYGGGEDFGSPFVGGQHQPPGTTDEAAVPYGGTPTVTVPSDGGDGGGNGGGNTTGSGATGGDDTTGSAYYWPTSDLFDNKSLFGINRYYDFLMDQQDATADQFIPNYTTNWKEVEFDSSKEADFTRTIPKDNTGFNWDWKNPNKLSYTTEGGSTITGEAGLNNFNLMYTKPLPFQEGGPVGGPEIDQSGIASLYPSDSRNPHVDDDELSGAWGRRPGGIASLPRALLDMLRKTENKPFGATRENVGEQLEAWRNAPHHVDPPNIGFMGEQIPAPLFDKAMKYLDSLPPSERAVIEEMLHRGFQQKRRLDVEKAIEEMQSAIPTLDA